MNICIIEEQPHSVKFKPLGGNSSRVLELVSWDLLELNLVVAEDSLLALLILKLDLAAVEKSTCVFFFSLRRLFHFRLVCWGLATSLALECNLLGEMF